MPRPAGRGGGRARGSRCRRQAPYSRVPPRMRVRSCSPVSPWPPADAAGLAACPASPESQDLDVERRPRRRSRSTCGSRRARVLEHVGQRLLHDPVGSQLDPGPRGRGFRPSSRVDLDARVAHVRHQGVEVVDGLRPAGRCAVGVLVAEQPEHRPGLGQRLAAGLGDDLEGVLGRVHVGPDDVRADACLDGDQRHAVRDDVVQLAGDPQALLDDGPGSVLAGGRRLLLGHPEPLVTAGRGATGWRRRAPTPPAAARRPAAGRSCRGRGRRAGRARRTRRCWRTRPSTPCRRRAPCAARE